MSKLSPVQWGAIALLAYLFLSGGSGTSGPDKVPEFPEPSADMQKVVQPFRDLLKGHENDARRLAYFYLAFADTIERDGKEKLIKTTDQIRTANQNFSVMLLQDAGLEAANESWVKAGDDAAFEVLGKENKELDDALRTKAVSFFNALAWACHQES